MTSRGGLGAGCEGSEDIICVALQLAGKLVVERRKFQLGVCEVCHNGRSQGCM